jgi:hypothetical protein
LTRWIAWWDCLECHGRGYINRWSIGMNHNVDAQCHLCYHRYQRRKKELEDQLKDQLLNEMAAPMQEGDRM